MKSEKGQSLVEFALILPVLILLLFGIVDFGRIFHAYLTLDHAGREAARSASIGEEDKEVIITVVKENASGLSLIDEKIVISENLGKSGEEVTITITYPVNFVTPVIGNIIGTFDLKNKTVMRIE
ncbi:pilus assembly protein [Aquibacillus halophilus]|uniref:Pilus assembly protein n=1 Tax=Aquibacillus halophilus TaxID=930132 RepID=A0A6A8DKM7_9BACI|nr:TadE family protein [Aquibacillus halophilus]MRH44309.1 pilus assembly protein [Aquibacillus halophilus]